MGNAKNILIQPISAKDANAIVKRFHYSGKVVNNSQLHFGVFYQGRCEGAMQFGPSLDKRKIQGLVAGTQWHEFLELNRMAFSDKLPRNSESRALGVAWKLLRTHAPQVKWVISFADATQCGDGTIYRAACFVLTGINQNKNLARLADGTVIHKMTLESNPMASDYGQINEGKNDFTHYLRIKGGERLSGYQLRYIYFLDPAYRQRLTVPEIPYAKIDELGIGMYKGQKRGASSSGDAASAFHAEEGGSTPTDALQK